MPGSGKGFTRDFEDEVQDSLLGHLSGDDEESPSEQGDEEVGSDEEE